MAAVATGAALALVTWCAAAAALVAIGLPFSLLAHGGRVTLADLRRGVWWGLLIVAIAAYFINLGFPLASGAAAFIVALLTVAGLVASSILITRRGWNAQFHVGWRQGILVTSLAVAVTYLAIAAMGPVTNYDSGLYHLGAIRYAAEFPSIPGIANIFFPFGYGNAEFPLAALLENGPWGAEGFRLLNGLVIALLCADLALRAIQRRTTAGYFVLLASATCVLVPMIMLADYWVTSPSQDSAVFAITAACVAMIADAVATRRRSTPNMATALAGSLLLVLLRPTMIAFLVGAVAVAIVLLVSRQGERDGASRVVWATAPLATVAVLAAVAATARDYVLSGWLQYPLSIYPFDVPWRAADPVNDRIATLGYHRDPGDLWNAAQSWGWIPSWIARLPQQWEMWAIAALGLMSMFLVAIAARQTALRGRALLIALIPSTAATAVWWLATPPSFRFAWGPVFTLVALPCGWALWRLSIRTQRWLSVSPVGVGLVIALTCTAGLATRMHWSEISSNRTWGILNLTYQVAPVPSVQTSPVGLGNGLVVITPTSGEQCWEAFPLCTPRLDGKVAGRGNSITDGYERLD